MHTCISDQRFARDVIRTFTSEEHNAFGDVVRCARAGERRRRDLVVDDFLVLCFAEAVGEPARADEAGADGVDADFRCQRTGERERHGVERAFGCSVSYR